MSRDILLNLIDPDSDQPRQHFDAAAITELAQSIAENGLIVPILLRSNGERFTIVHGERRYRAALELGWERIPADVRDMTPEAARWIALVENLQRADLTPIEEAEAYRAALADGITQVELGQRIGKSQSYIAQKLRLLDMPSFITLYVRKGALSEGHMRQLLRLKALYGENLPAPLPDMTKPLHIELPEVEAWCIMVPSMLCAIRPEDQPICWFYEDAWSGKVPMTEPLYRWIAEASKAFYESAYDLKTLPQWHIAAFWWASLAVYTEASVTALSNLIDGWRARFYSALMHLSIHEKPTQQTSELDRRRWWGYTADLRHSRATELVKDRDRVLEAIEAISNDKCEYLEPTVFQPWGQHHDFWLIHERLDIG